MKETKDLDVKTIEIKTNMKEKEQSQKPNKNRFDEVKKQREATSKKQQEQSKNQGKSFGI